MNTRKQFGQNVKALRKAKGLSQEAFGFEAEIHRTYISDIERGERNPSLEVIKKIAKHLGVTMGELVDYHLRK